MSSCHRLDTLTCSGGGSECSYDSAFVVKRVQPGKRIREDKDKDRGRSPHICSATQNTQGKHKVWKTSEVSREDEGVRDSVIMGRAVGCGFWMWLKDSRS